jgi:hypothetical protein
LTLLNNHTNIQMLNIKTPFFFPTSVFIFIRIFSPFLFLYQIPSSRFILSSGIWLVFMVCLCFWVFRFLLFWVFLGFWPFSLPLSWLVHHRPDKRQQHVVCEVFGCLRLLPGSLVGHITCNSVVCSLLPVGSVYNNSIKLYN